MLTNEPVFFRSECLQRRLSHPAGRQGRPGRQGEGRGEGVQAPLSQTQARHQADRRGRLGGKQLLEPLAVGITWRDELMREYSTS